LLVFGDVFVVTFLGEADAPFLANGVADPFGLLYDPVRPKAAGYVTVRPWEAEGTIRRRLRQVEFKMSEQPLVYHYTDHSGWNAIRSQMDWTFKASQPPGDRPYGVYFTTLRIDAPKFSKKTRIPVAKQEYVFAFVGTDGLGERDDGKRPYILISPTDYVVIVHRQRYADRSESMP